MGNAVDEARQERELTKQQLVGTIDKLEAKVRAELDWKARLRRDGARYAVMAVAGAVTLTTLVLLRAKLRGHDDEPESVRVASLDDISAELQSLRDELERVRKGKESQPLWQKVALRAVTTAGAAAGTLVARSMMERFSGGEADPELSPDA